MVIGTEALYSIDIDHFESFLKQQKKDAKHASKNPIQRVTASASSTDNVDSDEEVPDVDLSHEQLNLPPNSFIIWRIIPKLDYAAQVRIEEFILDINAIISLLVL